MQRRTLVPMSVALVATALAVGPGGAAQGRAPEPATGRTTVVAVVGRPDTGRLSMRLAALSDRAAGRHLPGLPVGDLTANRHGGVRRADDGRLVVDVDVEPHRFDGIAGRLASAGAEVLAVSPPAFHTVTAAVADGGLERLAGVGGVRHIREVVTPAVRCAPVVSEGDAQLRAALARSAYGIDGTGVTVGILSDSFDRSPPGAATNATADVAAGELPGAANPCGRVSPVAVTADNAPSISVDEGRAMAQVVHDLAPGADLRFATALVSETSFANNIAALVAAGARVIVDDVGYFNEPFYQDGPIAVAVNNARAAGVSYFTAAGNDNASVGGVDVGSYEALTYRPTPCPGALAGQSSCHGFDAGGTDATSQMVVASGRTLMIDLQWAQPRGAITTDYDICILDATTGAALACGAGINVGPNGSQQAFEIASYTNTTGAARAVNVAVVRFSGPAVRFKWILIGDEPAGVEYATSTATDVYGPAVYGHSGGGGAISVGAVPATNPSVVQPYSSRGPVTQLFHPVPSTVALGAPLVLAKPDVAASDCVRNSFFLPGSPAPHRFCGTSAAAPHAAAAAALMIGANPSLGPPEVASTLRAHAVPVAPAGTAGAGLVDVVASVASAISQAPTAASVGDATVVEGGAGATAGLAFPVTLSVPVGHATSVRYATGNGTASAPGDYAPTSGTLTIPAGQRSGTITVAVAGDGTVEADETVALTLANPVGAALADGLGVGTIVNDDQPPLNGYWLAAADGGIFAFGDARFLGSTGAILLNRPIVAMAASPSANGYWLVASDGGIFAFGDARFHGSTGALRLAQPIVGMVPTPSGNGYWLVASDGGIFAFGDARFHGSTGAARLNRPIVAMAASPAGNGYWLVASDGGIFAFGDARFLGSTGGDRLAQPVVGAAATPSGNGYWLVASDGGIFAFGDARFVGSTGAVRLNRPIVGMGATPSGGGYRLVASDGGIFTFGDARFFGSAGALRLAQPIVGIGTGRT